jgi:hypothetical protein
MAPPPPPPTSITLKIKVPPGYLSTDTDSFSLGLIPVSTPIGAVRQRIQELIPTHPAPEKQRILYGGRALVDNEQTLAGALNTKRDPEQEEYVVHLLVKGEGASAGPGAGAGHRRVVSSPAPAVGAQQNQPAQQPQSHTGAIGQQQPPHQHQHQHHHIAALHQQNIARAVQFQQQQLIQQMAAQNGGVLPPGFGNLPQVPHVHFANQQQQPPGFGQAVAHGQQQRAAMGMHGIGPQQQQNQVPQQDGAGGDGDVNASAGQGEAQQQQNTSQTPSTAANNPQNPAPQQQQQQHLPRPISGQGFHFEGIDRNGHRVQIHQQTVQFPGQLPFPSPQQPLFAGAMPQANSLFPPSPQGNAATAQPGGLFGGQQQPTALDTARENMAEMQRMIDEMRGSGEVNDDESRQRLQRLQQRVNNIRDYVDPLNAPGGLFGDAAGGRRSAPPAAEGQQAGGGSGLFGPPRPGGLFDGVPRQPQGSLFGPGGNPPSVFGGGNTAAPSSLFGNGANNAASSSLFGGANAAPSPLFGNNPNPFQAQSSIVQPQNRTNIFTGQPSSLFSPPPHADPANPTCYLLSSPTGAPTALLFSPQHGTFTTTPTVTGLRRPGFVPQTGALQAFQQAPQAAAGQPNAGAQAPAAPANQAVANNDLPPFAQAAARAEAAGQNQPQDPLGPFAPLINHMWLLLRVLIFAYFVLGSNLGWKRPLALVAIGVGFWMIRAGVLGDGGVVRRWWEGVVGVAPAPAAAVDGAAGADGQEGAQQGQQGAQQGRNGAMPTPEQVAQRLIDQHNERQNARVRQVRELVRPVERAVALFVASLWPGVGEAHVRAREAEERRRNEEEIAARRREEEERERAAAAAAGEEKEENTMAGKGETAGSSESANGGVMEGGDEKTAGEAST